jgi:threonine aldolase
VQKAHRIRKQLGGGMRQAGVLAAAGIVALETVVPRLAEDHQQARQLTEALNAIPGIILDPGTPQSNMVYLTLAAEIPSNAPEISRQLKDKDILVGVVGPRRFRLVTHYWINEEAVQKTAAAFQEILHP